MEQAIGIIVGILISAVISGAIIWLVSKLKLGLHVDSFGWAMIAGLLIGLITNLVMLVLPGGDGIIHFVINLVISAAVIFACGAMLKGLTVDGYIGALLAALSIAVISVLLLLVFLGGASLVGEAGGT